MSSPRRSPSPSTCRRRSTERFKASKNFLEGPDTVITWAVGHLAELAAPEHYDDKFKRWKMADLPILPEHFDVVPRAEGASAKSQLEAIAKLMKRDDIELIVNACDAGREGELIFAYVLDVAGKKGVPVQRAWFSSMTKDAIRQAFGHLRPGSELAPLEAAARSRSEADWLVGMNATRAATIRGRAAFGSTVVSLGRVQTPTLAILVRREKEIQAFEPDAVLARRRDLPAGRQDAPTAAATCAAPRRTSTTAEDADAIVARVRDGEGHVTSLSKRTQRSQPPLLYDLTALQREAASWHGFTARRTLSAAQGCYEKAVLTYPRTVEPLPLERHDPRAQGDRRPRRQALARSTRRAPPTCRACAELPLGRIVNNEKVTDHHAIIPTNAPQAGIELSPDEQRIYDMAARRFLAAFHPQAVFENTTVLTEVAGESFRSRGKVMLEAGWRAVYGEAPPDEAKAQGVESDEDEGADQELPPLEEGEHGPLHRGRRRRARDEAAAALRRGRAARRHGGRRQAGRGRRAARGHEGLGHRHARDARVHHRAPHRRRLHRARRPPPAADRQGHPGHRPARRARAHEPEPDRRLGAPPARHRARRRQPRGVHEGHREVHRGHGRLPARPAVRGARASSAATSTSSARAAARAT